MPRQAVVLAGGKGARLQAAVSDRPKVLAPASGRPFLDYLMRFLASEGLSDIILATGYMADQVAEFAGDGDRWGLRVHYSREKRPLGTGGALRQACQRYGLREFFALNGDTLFLLNLREMWQRHLRLQQKPAVKATIALRPIHPAEAVERGCVRLSNDGRIVLFDEKPASRMHLSDGQATPGHGLLSNAGVYILQQSALAQVMPGQKVSLERQVFPQFAERGRLAGFVSDGYFADIGTPESLARFEQDVAANATEISGLAI
jgi:NDP-sugar pyrophosphorylase family protein